MRASPADIQARPSEPQRSMSKLAQANQAINSAAKKGDLKSAEALMSELAAQHLVPDVVSFNAVIHACAKLGDVKRAETWLEKMQPAGVQPNPISFNILLDA